MWWLSSPRRWTQRPPHLPRQGYSTSIPPPGKVKDSPSDDELKSLKDTLSDTKPAGDLVRLTKTVDQAKAILTFIDAIAEKTLSSTVTLTAARGRGKSAALGLAMAAALAHGYSNIFVTSPSPENLKTLFELCSGEWMRWGMRSTWIMILRRVRIRSSIRQLWEWMCLRIIGRPSRLAFLFETTCSVANWL